MRHVDLDGIEYTGADLIPSLVASCRRPPRRVTSTV
jgi:hypothetical protein